jgi:hypothetical protein
MYTLSDEQKAIVKTAMIELAVSCNDPENRIDYDDGDGLESPRLCFDGHLDNIHDSEVDDYFHGLNIGSNHVDEPDIHDAIEAYIDTIVTELRTHLEGPQ